VNERFDIARPFRINTRAPIRTFYPLAALWQQR
jgi:hypothetical protein